MDVTPGDNVAELRTRMAIIHEGRILLEAEPLRAVEALEGRTIAHVFADTNPCTGFEAVQPDLKDVYFSVMAGKHGGPPVAPP